MNKGVLDSKLSEARPNVQYCEEEVRKHEKIISDRNTRLHIARATLQTIERIVSGIE